MTKRNITLLFLRITFVSEMLLHFLFTICTNKIICLLSDCILLSRDAYGLQSIKRVINIKKKNILTCIYNIINIAYLVQPKSYLTNYIQLPVSQSRSSSQTTDISK